MEKRTVKSPSPVYVDLYPRTEFSKNDQLILNGLSIAHPAGTSVLQSKVSSMTLGSFEIIGDVQIGPDQVAIFRFAFRFSMHNTQCTYALATARYEAAEAERIRRQPTVPDDTEDDAAFAAWRTQVESLRAELRIGDLQNERFIAQVAMVDWATKRPEIRAMAGPHWSAIDGLAERALNYPKIWKKLVATCFACQN